MSANNLKKVLPIFAVLLLLPNVAWAEDYSGYGVLLYAMAVLPFLPFNIVNLAIAWKFQKKEFW